MKLGITVGRVSSIVDAVRKMAKIAFGAELGCIVAALTEDLVPGPRGSEVGARIDQLLDDVLPNHTGDANQRARGLFRRTLLEEMGLESKDGRHRARKSADTPPSEQKTEEGL